MSPSRSDKMAVYTYNPNTPEVGNEEYEIPPPRFNGNAEEWNCNQAESHHCMPNASSIHILGKTLRENVVSYSRDESGLSWRKKLHCFGSRIGHFTVLKRNIPEERCLILWKLASGR